jgi:putative membrane protein insertion efficiency factor
VALLAMRRQRPLTYLAISLVETYQERISSQLPARCAYSETCSQYAVRQLSEHGFVRGGWAAYRRYRRCDAAAAERLSTSSVR